MNKRIKLKKGILHKRCDESCWLYRNIKENEFFMSVGCDGCKFYGQEAINSLLLTNANKSGVIIID